MRGERGSASVLAAAGLGVVALLTAVLVVVGLLNAGGQRVRGAADLAALAGARAQAAGQDACEAAGRSTRLNAATVTRCSVAGDEVEFVVSVAVRGEVVLVGVRHELDADAHAGTVTGAPE